jgi:aspartate carbamoyltransferase regulatory subunit
VKIEQIKNGIVIDHITAGKGEELYKLLELDKLEIPVAIMKNMTSAKMGKKDIIKVDGEISLNTDIIGYVDPRATVNIIKEGKTVSKNSVSLPRELKNVIFCKNPRCITSCEQELDHIFKLTDEAEREYRCLYCETKAK